MIIAFIFPILFYL